MNYNSPQIQKILHYLKILLLFLIIYITTQIVISWNVLSIVFKALSLLTPFFIAFSIVWLLNPSVTYLEKKGIQRGYGAIIVFLICGFLIVIFVQSFIPVIVDQFIKFGEYIPNLTATLQLYALDVIDFLQNSGLDYNFNQLYSDIINTLNDQQTLIMDYISSFSKQIIFLITNFITSIIQVILILTMSFYLLIDFPRFKRNFKRVIPRRFRETTFNILEEINVAVSGYVRSFFIITVIIIVITSIIFVILDLQAALLLALIVGLTNIIPYIGPVLGAVPALLVGLSDNLTTGFFVLLTIIFIQQFDGFVLKPILIGKTTNLSPVEIILGIFVFGSLFGFVGILLAAPIVSTIKILLKYINLKYKLVEDEVVEEEQIENIEL